MKTTFPISTMALLAAVAISASGQTAPKAIPGFVGVLDLNFGEITPVVTGFQSPHGMAFVKTHNDDDEGRGHCNADDSQ
jgi:hypothetical protein